MKAAIFVQELLSVVLTPIILTMSLPASAPDIIDFFREFTVHVDTLGYVCSFAVFDFKRHGNIRFGAPSFGEHQNDENKRSGGWQEDERLQSKDGKMEKSFLAFKAAHPEWTPTDPTGSLYLERLREMHQDLSHPAEHGTGGISRRSTAPAFGAGSTMLARSTLAERSEMYEKALAQSMANARARRGAAGSFQITAGPSNPARRQGSLPQHTQLGQTQDLTHREPYTVDGAVQDDRAEDGGIGSELGDSYVDDVRTRGGRIILDPQVGDRRLQDEEDELEAEELANGGVLGLLAQIYDRKRPVI
jgi:autophagy-related protein 9